MTKTDPAFSLPYLCALLIIKRNTAKKGYCTVAELTEALAAAIGPQAEARGYVYITVGRMVKRGFVEKKDSRTLVYIDSKENNNELNRNLHMLNAVRSIAKQF